MLSRKGNEIAFECLPVRTWHIAVDPEPRRAMAMNIATCRMLAGCAPAGVLAEIVNDDGTMAHPKNGVDWGPVRGGKDSG